jgi:hypothetical protein
VGSRSFGGGGAKRRRNDRGRRGAFWKTIESRDALLTDHDVADEVAIALFGVGGDVANGALCAGAAGAFDRAPIVEGIDVFFGDAAAFDAFEPAFGVPGEGSGAVAKDSPRRVVVERFAAVMGELIGALAVFTVVVDHVERRDVVVGLDRGNLADVVVVPSGGSDAVAGLAQPVAVVERKSSGRALRRRDAGAQVFDSGDPRCSVEGVTEIAQRSSRLGGCGELRQSTARVVATLVDDAVAEPDRFELTGRGPRDIGGDWTDRAVQAAFVVAKRQGTAVRVRALDLPSRGIEGRARDVLGAVLPAPNARGFAASSIVAEVHAASGVFDPGQIAGEMGRKLRMGGAYGVVVVSGHAPLSGLFRLLVPFLGHPPERVVHVTDMGARRIDAAFDVVAAVMRKSPGAGIRIFDADAPGPAIVEEATLASVGVAKRGERPCRVVGVNAAKLARALAFDDRPQPMPFGPDRRARPVRAVAP